MKFRAWDKEFNIMSEVKSIDYRAECVELSDGEPYLQDFSKVELMKSTGIFDKDSKEIFEGDILGIETDKVKVKVNVFWNSEHALFMFESKNTTKRKPWVNWLEIMLIRLKSLGTFMKIKNY